jgi:hypothetical protein
MIEFQHMTIVTYVGQMNGFHHMTFVTYVGQMIGFHHMTCVTCRANDRISSHDLCHM